MADARTKSSERFTRPKIQGLRPRVWQCFCALSERILCIVTSEFRNFQNYSQTVETSQFHGQSSLRLCQYAFTKRIDFCHSRIKNDPGLPALGIITKKLNPSSRQRECCAVCLAEGMCHFENQDLPLRPVLILYPLSPAKFCRQRNAHAI